MPLQITEVRRTRPRKVKVPRVKTTRRKPRPPDCVPDLLSDLSGRNNSTTRSDSSGRKPRSHLVKSSAYDVSADEYYTNSSYTPESLNNCHNITLDSPTAGPIIFEKLDNGTNIVWTCVSSDSGLSCREHSVPRDNDAFPEAETDVASENANDVEHDHEIISDVNTSSLYITPGTITEPRLNVNDDHVENFEQVFTEVDHNEILKEGATCSAIESSVVNVSDTDDTNREENSDGAEPDKDDVFEDSGQDDSNVDAEVNERKRTLELTVAIDLPKYDNMLCVEDIINDNVVNREQAKSMVGAESNNNIDVKSPSTNELNEGDRIFLPRRRSSTKEVHVKKLSQDNVSNKQENDLSDDSEKKTFRSPLSSVDQFIEILACHEKYNSTGKIKTGPNENCSDLKSNTRVIETELTKTEDLSNDIQSYRESVSKSNIQQLDTNEDEVVEVPDRPTKGDLEDLICVETPELSQAAETEEKLLQSLNILHDSIKLYTNSLKEKDKSKRENQSIKGETAVNKKIEAGAEQTCLHHQEDDKNIKEGSSELGDVLDNNEENSDLIDSLYEPGNLKDSYHGEGENEKCHSPIKDIPQIVNEPVFFDSNYEEVTVSDTQNPPSGEFFLSEVEQSETMYAQGVSGERGNITLTWAEFTNSSPDANQTPLKESAIISQASRSATNLDERPKILFEITASDERPKGASQAVAPVGVAPVSTLEPPVYSTNNDKKDTETCEGQENKSHLHNLSSDSLEDLIIIEPLDKCLDLIETSSLCSSEISQDSLCEDEEDNLIAFSQKDNRVETKNSTGDERHKHVKGQSGCRNQRQCHQMQRGRGDQVNVRSDTGNNALIDKKFQSLIHGDSHPEDMNETLSSYTDDSIELEEEVDGADSGSQLSSTLFETDTTPTSTSRQPVQFASNTKSSKTSNVVQEVGSKVQGNHQGSTEGHSDYRNQTDFVLQESFYLSDSGRPNRHPGLVPGSEFMVPHGFVYRRPLKVGEEADSDSLSSDSLGDDDHNASDSEIQILTEYGDQSLKMSPRDHLECIAEEGQGEPPWGARRGQRRSRSYQQRSRSDVCDGATSPSGYEEDATAL